MEKSTANTHKHLLIRRLIYAPIIVAASGVAHVFLGSPHPDPRLGPPHLLNMALALGSIMSLLFLWLDTLVQLALQERVKYKSVRSVQIALFVIFLCSAVIIGSSLMFF